MKGTLPLQIPGTLPILKKCPHFTLSFGLSAADFTPRPLGRGLLLVRRTHKGMIRCSRLNCSCCCIREFVTLVRVSHLVAIQPIISIRLLPPPLGSSLLDRLILPRGIPYPLISLTRMHLIWIWVVFIVLATQISLSLALYRAACKLNNTFTSKINLLSRLISNLVRMSSFAQCWKALFRTDYCGLSNIAIESQLLVVSWPYELSPDYLCHLIDLVLKINWLLCCLEILRVFQRLSLRLLHYFVLLVLMIKLPWPLWARGTSKSLPLLMRRNQRPTFHPWLLSCMGRLWCHKVHLA